MLCIFGLHRQSKRSRMIFGWFICNLVTFQTSHLRVVVLVALHIDRFIELSPLVLPQTQHRTKDLMNPPMTAAQRSKHIWRRRRAMQRLSKWAQCFFFFFYRFHWPECGVAVFVLFFRFCAIDFVSLLPLNEPEEITRRKVKGDNQLLRTNVAPKNIKTFNFEVYITFLPFLLLLQISLTFSHKLLKENK